ncbi:HNH endonuclease signature motif containing protein [Paramicrobacterium fandaimingii]|uniref:HNH endonuclease signature motif containing protein n=1 Tax=Paramicrobacterium fandaimingii TaxID=2708079 RepID=UPI0014211444|nr:HNH endonuclease signature motif containing protein [Microbacterium fandaimingii]
MQKPIEHSIEAVAGIASAAATRVLETLPRSAAAASDDALLEAAAALGELGRAQQTALAVVASEIATRSVKLDGAQTIASRNGQRDAIGLLQSTARISHSAARRARAYGDAITIDSSISGAPLPPRWSHIAEAAFAGTVDAEAVAPLIRSLEEVRLSADPQMLDAAEDGMMRIASRSTPEYAKQQMRVWKEALDPDGARPREEAQRQARFFHIGKVDAHGMTPIKGRLTPDAAARLNAAISTHTNPRARVAFRPVDESEDATAPHDSNDNVAPSVGTHDLDPRTHGQKLHDIIDGLISSGHRASVSDAGSRRAQTEVIVTTTLEDLRSGDGVGWANGAQEPLGPITTERIICDEGYRRMILGDNGEALWLGHKQRAFSPQQKLAIAARDETCGWPECDMPADWCDVHHVTYWSQDGPTDVDNGLLLCSAHHHMLHAQNWIISMQNGIPFLTPPAFMRHAGEPIRLGQNRPRQVGRTRRTRRRRRGNSRAGGSDPPDSS